MTRRVVYKITPSRQSSFDQQFWPVLVALTVLSGIALGAILTVLNGPWFWGSLLLLPILSASAIFLLFNLDNATLRRSLQFAIILSLALHLFLLVFAAVTSIFQNPFKPHERQVAQQRKVRTIEISDQRAAFVFEETNARETPEPEIETKKQEQPTTNAKPQPIPVPETKPEVNPQLTKRETTSQSVPRQNRELSKLKRQTQDHQPQSSQQNTGDKLATSKTAAASAKSNEATKSAQQADAVSRQSAPLAQSQPEPAKKAPAPESNTKQEVARTSSRPRRANPTQPLTESAPQASASTAQNRKSTPNIPIASKQSPVIEKLASATTKTPTDSSPAKSSGKTTRRPEQSRTIPPALANRPKTELSPRPQVARAAERRSANQLQPSISNKASVTLAPRRSTRESRVAASPLAFENPSRAPQSDTATRELKSKTLSVSRSTEGVTGVGRSNNLDRFAGGMTSPANRASDSARRERTQSKSNEARMLSSSEKSEVRRSIGANQRPTSAFKAETSSAAKIAGSNNLSERSMESSAANVDSASTNHRDKISAEKGDAAVDLGPTKVVMDRESIRRSGGGQPEVSQLNPESTRPSKDRSQQQPSLLAAAGLDVAAPSNPSTASPSIEAIEASEQSMVAAKSGGESAITAQRSAAEIAGQISDQGESNLAQSLADSRERASRDQDESGWDSREEDIDGENPGGTKRTRIAQAPVVRSDPGTGLARSDGRATIKSDQPGDSPNESLATNVSRQANASIPGSGIGRSAANVLIQAATSVPIIEASRSRRTGSSTSTNTAPDLTSGLANSRNKNTRASKTPNVTPSLSGLPDSSLSMESKRVGSSESRELDSTSVTVARTDLAAMEQIQGSKLDVIADEGPAGLGIRPDDHIGVMSRPSSRDSEQIQPDLNTRFRNPRFGGTPAVNPDAVIARDAFRNRNPAAMSGAAEPTTEAAIHLGLEFLARYQSRNGSWSLTGFDREAPQHRGQLDSDTAATGLALLAFQGAGYNHREFKYARQIDQAIQWLIDNQAEDGGLYVPTDTRSNGACRLYSHGIAALALTEAYGMTQDVRLKEPAQKALNYITSSQDPRKGGWRYFDEPAKKSSDTSVSGWMMMALQSGRLAGLDVDPKAFDSIEDWLDVAADPEDASRYRYNPYAEDSKGVSRERQGRTPTPSMTSVGLLMRIYSGWDRDDPRLLAGADYLLKQQLPSDSAPLLRDTYYWYYATQVLKHIDGPRWKTWNDRLRPLLTRSQEKTGDLAGSWHPYRPVPDRWGQFGGRIYVTTMNLLSLEVRHRLLPLYNQGKPPKTSSRIESIPQHVSTNRMSKPRIVSRNETTVRRPSVGPGTTRAKKPKPPRRPMTLGLNNPPAITRTSMPRRTNSSWPTIGAATQPGEVAPPIGSASLTEPVVELSAVKRETNQQALHFSRPEIDEVQIDSDKSIQATLKKSNKANIDATQPSPDLFQPVALRPKSWKLQPYTPEPTVVVLDKTPPMSGLRNLPTLDEPIQPLESELQFAETQLADPVSALSIMKLDVASQANPLSRNDVIEAPLSSNRPLLSTIDRPAKANPVDPSPSSFELAHSIAWGPDSLRRQPRMPSLSDVVAAKKPSVPALKLPTLDAAIQPIENELSITEITLAEPVSALSIMKLDVASQANPLSRNDVIEAPLSSNRPLLSTIDLPAKANPVDPSPSSFELAHSIAWRPDSLRRQPRMPSLSDVVAAKKPSVPALKLPTLDAAIQPLENELSITEFTLAEPVSTRSTIKPDVAPQVNRFSGKERIEVSLDANRPLISLVDRTTRANLIDPSESNSESVSSITFDADSKKARPSTSGTVLPVRSEKLLIADPNNQNAIVSHLRAVESESRISESKKAASVPKLMVEQPVNNSQIKNLPSIEFSESSFDAARPLRSRIKQLRSRLANRSSNQPQFRPLESIGFGSNFNRPISRIPRPLAPILTKILPGVAKRKPAPPKPVSPKPASQFVSASGVVTLDGEILKAATIELVRQDVEDGKRISVQTDASGRFNFVPDGSSKQTGVKAGKYKVSVTTFVESPDEDVIDFLETVPAKYNSETTLIISISPIGPNVFDLKLVSE